MLLYDLSEAFSQRWSKYSKQKKVILLEKGNMDKMDIIDEIAFSIIKRIFDKECIGNQISKHGERKRWL
jgi:hypothetical protein